MMKQHNYFNLDAILVALVLIVLYSADIVTAQNESGVRPWRTKDSIIVPFNFSEGGKGEYRFHAAYPIIS